MLRFKLTKEQRSSFPSLSDSLNLYKDAIITSVEEDDLQTTIINFSKLISILERHNKKENRLNAELVEARKRYFAFQRLSKMSGGSIFKVSAH